jgi:hypothetical protein
MEGGNKPRFVVNTTESNLGGSRLTNTKGVNYVKMDLQNNANNGWNSQKIQGKACCAKV